MAETRTSSKPRSAGGARRASSGPALKAARKPSAGAAEPAGRAGGLGAEATLKALTAEQREALETRSANLARAALTAQGAIAEASLRQADRPAALSPDPFHVAPALTDVIGQLAARPERLMRA